MESLRLVFEHLEDNRWNFCYSYVKGVYEFRVWKYLHPVMPTDTRKREVYSGTGPTWQDAMNDLQSKVSLDGA